MVSSESEPPGTDVKDRPGVVGNPSPQRFEGARAVS